MDSLPTQKPIYEVVGSQEYLTSHIVKGGFSKSGAIEHFETVANDLKEILSKSNLHDGVYVKIELKESIKLYEKIATGLKDLWRFGDFDVIA
ncbi:MAG: putative alkaline shock family protein YloU [Sulfurimonas sp.]|jgi:uncharacterized alkaline shock family protein YloU|uniref:hypothetical protein n=1 Tax=Sulfurimonas sp. TaxID=2022749 RepID=UPI0039E24FAA